MRTSGETPGRIRRVERRASSIRDYLVTRGVDDDRIITVTYAVQRPVCQEPLEACWAQNRRAVVRMTR